MHGLAMQLLHVSGQPAILDINDLLLKRQRGMGVQPQPSFCVSAGSTYQSSSYFFPSSSMPSLSLGASRS